MLADVMKLRAVKSYVMKRQLALQMMNRLLKLMKMMRGIIENDMIGSRS